MLEAAGAEGSYPCWEEANRVKPAMLSLTSSPFPFTGQVIACALCCLLMRTRQPWLFSAPLLPLLARLSGLPLHALPMASIFAMALTTLQVLYVMASHILVPFRLAAAACREVAQVRASTRGRGGELTQEGGSGNC